jgi:hypothetical protein
MLKADDRGDTLVEQLAGSSRRYDLQGDCQKADIGAALYTWVYTENIDRSLNLHHLLS